MTSPEAATGSADERPLPTSRRSFLLLAGSSAGVGLSAAPAAGADGDDAPDPVTVVASPPERGPVREAVERVRAGRSSGGDAGSVTFDVTETTAGLRRFTAGDVDVLAGSRPILPAERSRAAENGVDYTRREFPTATAALRHPDSSWVDPLRPARLAETWAGDGEVETWAEVDPRAEANAGSGGGPHEELTDGTTNGRREDRTPPTRDGTVLVRGVRAHQYATGFGGVGYYEPDRDWLGRSAEAVERGTDSHTPLVRLAFLYVDREAIRRRTVEEFVRAYARRSAKRTGGVPFFGDPFGRGPK